jgi:hypothetical protein
LHLLSIIATKKAHIGLPPKVNPRAKTQNPIQKITKKRLGEGRGAQVSQMVECLPSKGKGGATVAHAYNSSYSGDRNQEDYSG